MNFFSPDSNPPDLQIPIRTLIVGGFTLDNATRFPGYALIYTHRYDEFGVKQQYCFALFEKKAEAEEIASAKIAATYNKAELVIISLNTIPDTPSMEWSRFLNIFGGPVYSHSVLDPEFGDCLSKLGSNVLPEGMAGKPDELFEIYVHHALEFIFGCKVHRYGQARLFEARPDGVILLDRLFSALYDAKSFSKGYKVNLDSIRQFSSYTADFRGRYNQFIELNSFIVISGSFPDSTRTLEKRSRQFLSEVNIPLSFLTTDSMVEIIHLLSDFPSARRAINWRKIFVNPVTDPYQIRAELNLIWKDKIISKTPS
jgi:hypothetical protein